MVKINKFLIVTIVTSVLLLQIGCAGKNNRKARKVEGLTSINFEFNSATLSAEALRKLDQNIKYLNTHKDIGIVIEGHCDERGTNEYNLALGDRRANSARKYLTNRGLSKDRTRTVSYGEERPIDNGHNEAAWFKNRRAEFIRR